MKIVKITLLLLVSFVTAMFLWFFIFASTGYNSAALLLAVKSSCVFAYIVGEMFHHKFL